MPKNTVLGFFLITVIKVAAREMVEVRVGVISAIIIRVHLIPHVSLILRVGIMLQMHIIYCISRTSEVSRCFPVPLRSGIIAGARGAIA